MKITLHLLALCLLLSITTKVSGKPNPGHLLIETDEQAKKTADYNDDYQIQNMNNNKFTNTHVNNIQRNGGNTNGAISNVNGNTFNGGTLNNIQNDNSGDIVLGGGQFNNIQNDNSG